MFTVNSHGSCPCHLHLQLVEATVVLINFSVAENALIADLHRLSVLFRQFMTLALQFCDRTETSNTRVEGVTNSTFRFSG